MLAISQGVYYNKLHRVEICGCSSMVECQLPKLNTGVRFPSPAPMKKDVPQNLRFATHPFQCSAEVNSAYAKVFAQAKTLVRRTSAARLCGTLYL